MDVLADSLEGSLRRDLDLAWVDLAAALREQERKDTPASRQTVAESRARMDGILDLWNAALQSDP